MPHQCIQNGPHEPYPNYLRSKGSNLQSLINECCLSTALICAVILMISWYMYTDTGYRLRNLTETSSWLIMQG